MTSVRQWLDAVWPKAKKLRWFAAAWLALILVAVPWGLRAQERALESAARDALAEAGVAVDDVTFSGRSGVVVAALDATDRARAEAALAEVTGIRSVDWQVKAPPPPPVPTTTTTTTTTVPPGEPAAVTIRVRAGRMVIGGIVPDAADVARIQAAATRLYAPAVTNHVTVGEVWLPEWVGMAPDVIAMLPMAGRAEVTMDGDGVTVVADVASADDERVLLDRLHRLLGPDTAVDASVAVLGDGVPAVTITATGGGTVTVAGTVNRRTLVDAIIMAVARLSDAEPVGELTLDKSLAETYPAARIPQLVARLGDSAIWSLDVGADTLAGEATAGDLFRADAPGATPRGIALVDELAAQLLADPEMRIEIDLTPAEGGRRAATRLVRQRLAELANALVRAGVDPDRITTSIGDAEDPLLRFRLEVTEG